MRISSQQIGQTQQGQKWILPLREQHHIEMVKQNILPPFNKRIWQRNYWEHIIRNEKEHQQIIQYIIDNPKKWALDKLNNHSDAL